MRSLKDIGPSGIDVGLHLAGLLMRIACDFQFAGVVYKGLNPGNVLFCASRHPTGAVILDFGHAYVRKQEFQKH